jgi:hypothetical protein
MTQLMIDPNFDWSNYREIDIKITGIPGAIDVKRTLTLRNGDAVYLNMLFGLNQNLTSEIIVPKSLTSLTLEFGSFEQTFDISGGEIVYSFVPVIEE